MMGEFFCIHAVYSISLFIDDRHTGIWFGDNWNRNIFFNVSNNRYQLIRSH